MTFSLNLVDLDFHIDMGRTNLPKKKLLIFLDVLPTQQDFYRKFISHIRGLEKETLYSRSLGSCREKMC